MGHSLQRTIRLLFQGMRVWLDTAGIGGRRRAPSGASCAKQVTSQSRLVLRYERQANIFRDNSALALAL